MPWAAGVEEPPAESESTALVLRAEVAAEMSKTPPPPAAAYRAPRGAPAPLGTSVRDIADYRAAAKLKYEQAKSKGQLYAGAGELKSLRDLLEQSFHGVLEVRDGPDVQHKSEEIGEDIGASCPSTPVLSSSLDSDAPDAEALRR